MKNVSSGDRRPFFLTPDGGILPHAGCGIRRIRKGDDKILPILAGLVKRLVIQCEPGMAVEIRQFFSYPTMKNYWISQSSSEPIERQRPWKAISFCVIGKELKPTIHIVNQITHHCLIKPSRH